MKTENPKTYSSFLEELGTAEEDGIQRVRSLRIKKDYRKEAGEKVRKYIRKNWRLVPRIKDGQICNFYKPNGVTSLKTENLERLYEFFFLPKKVIKIYNYE